MAIDPLATEDAAPEDVSSERAPNIKAPATTIHIPPTITMTQNTALNDLIRTTVTETAPL